jgi:hypothetical protein
MIGAIPDLHAAMLSRVIEALQNDPRIDAVLGGGSLVHGGFDQQSDLDLVVVVCGDAYAAVMAERRVLAARAGELLAAFTGEHVGEPRLLICLFGPPLIHVDLKFVIAADLDAVVERPVVVWARNASEIGRRLDAARVCWPEHDPQWFEDRAWIWLHYGATKLLRGELFEAIGMLAFFREQVLGPMLRREAELPQRGIRRIDSVPEMRTRLSRTVAGYDRVAVTAALEQMIALYVELRQRKPPPAPVEHMPEALIDFLRGA